MIAYNLFTNDIYRGLINSNVLPRIGDTIMFNDVPYEVSNVKHVIGFNRNVIEINVLCK